MKPLKNKDNKTQKDCDLSTPKIDSYFKAAAKQFNVQVEETSVCDVSEERAVYVEALKKKLQDLEGPRETFDELEEGAAGGTQVVEHEKEVHDTSIQIEGDRAQNLENEPVNCLQCTQWKAKYDDMQKFCLKLTIRNANMDLKYEDLVKTKTCVKDSLPGAASSTDEFFTPKELAVLDCMSIDKTFDYTFVRNCLEYIYKDNLAVLSKKTLKGTAEILQISDEGVVERVIESKGSLTPPKVDRIRKLFIERITGSGLGAVEFSERIKDTYLNRLIAAGLQNISKRKLL